MRAIDINNGELSIEPNETAMLSHSEIHGLVLTQSGDLFVEPSDLSTLHFSAIMAISKGLGWFPPLAFLIVATWSILIPRRIFFTFFLHSQSFIYLPCLDNNPDRQIKN